MHLPFMDAIQACVLFHARPGFRSVKSAMETSYLHMGKDYTQNLSLGQTFPLAMFSKKWLADMLS